MFHRLLRVPGAAWNMLGFVPKSNGPYEDGAYLRMVQVKNSGKWTNVPAVPWNPYVPAFQCGKIDRLVWRAGVDRGAFVWHN